MSKTAPKMGDERKPGWYVNEEGVRRFWDGQEWHLEKPEKKKKDVQIFVFGKFSIPKARVFLGIAVLALLGLAGGAVGVVVGVVIPEQQRQEAVLAEKQAAEAQERESAERIAAAEEIERDRRAVIVTEVEARVKTEAEKAQSAGVIAGSSIISATCTPTSGSLDDLLAASTEFECFSAHTDNGDGTLLGAFWDVTVNWDTGAYTWKIRL